MLTEEPWKASGPWGMSAAATQTPRGNGISSHSELCLPGGGHLIVLP